MSSTTREIGGHTIDLSNPDKIFFPDADVTKGDLVDYYERVADTMLPHLRDRFVSMHRWPDGIEGEDFYQKNAPDYFPGWIRTEAVEKEDGTNRQVVIDEPATLVYLADQACVTPHIWLSRAGSPRHPDRMVFDFDPSDDWEKSFDGVRWAARRLRAVLEDIGLESRVMTSGSRGLHVHVALDADSDFDEVKELSRDVAELLARRYPDRLTTEVRKKERADRIFIDYLRNEYAQTTVAPYAIRARPGAPVATPVDWDELSASEMGPRRYTVRNIFRRLGRKSDPWRDLDEEAQSLAGPREALDELRQEDGK